MMDRSHHKLPQILSALRNRLLGLWLLSGAGWGVAACAIALGVFAWLDLALDLPPGVRAACAAASLGIGALLLLWAAAMAIRHGSEDRLARRLDNTAGAAGQVLTGIDLYRQCQPPAQSDYVYSRPTAAAAAMTPLSAALAAMAVDRASRLATGVRASAAVPANVLYRPWAASVLVGLCALLLFALAPHLAATQWARFTDPYGDHPPYSSLQFKVEPGNTRVLYGSGMDVHVTTEGGVAEQLDLVLQTSHAGAAGAAAQVLPMFPEPDGGWRATVADVTEPGTYLIRARGGHGARSAKFTFDVITVPELKDVRFKITPPAYTHRPPYEGPLPQGGLSGLPGTIVEVRAASNRPLSGGSFRFAPASPPATAPADAAPPAQAITPPPASVLAPTGPGASEVAGSFVITAPGKVELKVIDAAGQESRDMLTAPVTLLSDDRPFVRILDPKANSFATPDVKLNISLVAEDDYGVSRVQVFRGLNESRVRPTEVPVPPSQPTRLPATVPLDLAEYGLNPGDVVKLYARVEDNDPAGAKGYECPVVLVHIISEEEMQRMTLAREGLEVLQSKYEQVGRRLERLNTRIDQLEKELEKAAKDDPDGKLAQELRDKIESLAQESAEAALEAAKTAAEDLPFDIDKAFKAQIDAAAQAMERAAREADDLAKTQGLSAAGAKKGLEKVREQLGPKQEQFKKQATDPLDYLAKVFPLKEDEARFLDVYQRQRDLAERMRSLEDQPANDPKVKSRMRDLEAEQRQLKDDLRQLLGDIDDHITGLPQDPRLDDLRKSARAFADALRKSDAADKMAGSESLLSEFSGAPAAAQAREAADTLEKFIAQCSGMGNQASDDLKFQPELASGLGNTVDQLLAAEGLLPGPGPTGRGSSGGYSQRRSTLSNVGLYGKLPAMTNRPQNSGGGKNRPGAVVGGSRDDEGPGDSTGGGNGARLHAAGESDAAVPVQYRKKVGEYFQRVSDELGSEK